MRTFGIAGFFFILGIVFALLVFEPRVHECPPYSATPYAEVCVPG